MISCDLSQWNHFTKLTHDLKQRHVKTPCVCVYLVQSMQNCDFDIESNIFS